jgi:Flp pilus assembly protein TadG
VNRRDERGSAAVEAVIGVPAFALFVGLIIFGGRTAMTHGAVESAAADGARTASIARTSEEARASAEEAARASLANQGIDCIAIQVVIDSSDFVKPVGAPGSVEVTVSCRLNLGDLAVPGIPGSRTVTATVTSPLDSYRERS